MVPNLDGANSKNPTYLNTAPRWPVTHMPETLYISSAMASTISTVAITLLCVIICSAGAQGLPFKAARTCKFQVAGTGPQEEVGPAATPGSNLTCQVSTESSCRP